MPDAPHDTHRPDAATGTAPGPPPDTGSLDAEVHAVALRFDQAWAAAPPPPDLLAFLPPPGPLREAVFRELLAIDEERRRAAGLPSAAADYRAAAPDLTARATAAPPAPLPGMPTVPGYEIAGELGRGAMGVVYDARQVRLDRRAALKVVRGAADPTLLARFRAEAEAVAAARHPHVVQVYEAGQHAGGPYLAMEYLPGGTLADRLRAAGRLPPRDAAGVVAKVARGVGAAHDLGIVHRDLKPGNVLFDAAGEPKVADFGLAKRPAVDLTATDALMGTPAYMAPEQAGRRAKFAGPAADVWALGVILYECLTGRRPFAGEDAAEVLARIADAEPAAVRSVRPGVPRDLDTVVRKCLAKEPHRRYPTAGELADDLDRFARGEPITARPLGPAGRAARWVRRNPYPTALAAVVFAALAVVAAGAVVAAAVMKGERDRANRAEAGRSLALAESLIREAEIARTRPQAGRRDRCLTLVREAAALLAAHAGPDDPRWEQARNVALSVLTVPDLVAGPEVPLDALATAVCDRAVTRVAVYERTGKVRVRSLPDGREVFATDAPAVEDREFAELGFSPDGELLVIASRSATQRHRSAVWDLAPRGGPPKQLLDLPGRVMANGFRADSAWVCHHTPEAGVVVIDARTGAAVRDKLTGPLVLHARFSPDGTRLAAALGEGVVRVFDTATWQAAVDIRAPVAHVAMGWSPDGTHLVTGDGAGRVTVSDARTGQAVWCVHGHGGMVVWADFAPDAPVVVTAGWDNAVRLWQAATGAPVVVAPGAYARAHGGRVAVVEHRRLVVYRLDDGVGRTVVPTPGPALAAQFSPGGTLLVVPAVRGADFTTLLLDPRTGAERGRVPAGHVEDALFHPDGRSVYTHGVAGVYRWPVEEWTAADGTPRCEVGPPAAVLPAGGAFLRLAPGRGGRVAATDNAARRVVVADEDGGNRVHLPGGPFPMTGPTCTPDGAFVAAASWGAPDVYVWDAARPAAPRRLPLGAEQPPPLSAARFSPDGAHLVAFSRIGEEARVRCWRTADWGVAWTAAGEAVSAEAVARVCFSPDARFVAHPVSPHRFALTDVRTGRRVHEFTREDRSSPIPHSFSPDGRRLAVSTRDARLELYDLGLLQDWLDRLGLGGPARPALLPASGR